MPSLRKPITKAEKSLILVCVFVALPLAGIVYLYGGRDAEPNWNIPPATPRPNPNGYDLYVALAKATVRFKPEVDPESDTTSGVHTPGSPYALKNYSLVRRQQWLHANSHTFALFNKALTTPSQVPRYSPEIPTLSADRILLRQLARDVSTRTRIFQMQHEQMKATMSAIDGIQMAQSAMHGGGLVARIVGVSITSTVRTPLEDWNKTINTLSANEARVATRRLEAVLQREPSITQTFQVDKRDELIELRRIFDVKGWRHPYTPQSLGTVTGEGPLQTWQRQTISRRAIYNNLNRGIHAEIAICNLPYSQAIKAALPSDLDVFSRQLMVLTDRFVALETRHKMSNTMLLMRLALRAYIVEHGTAPPTLAELVPSYLKAIPTDVYNDGKPLFYIPLGKRYKLWSVGPDGVNNGGVPLARTSQDKPGLPTLNRLDSKGDFVAGLCR